MRDWIEIKGRKFLWEDFVNVLDSYRHEAVIRTKGARVSRPYARKIGALQESAFVYHEGKDHIDGRLEDYIVNHAMDLPAERKLPEAIGELFEQLQSSLGVDLSDLLDDCVEQSKTTYRNMQEMEQKEKERVAFIKSLPLPHEDMESGDLEKKVCYLVKLQKAKKDHSDYEINFLETKVTYLWCDILLFGLSFEKMPYGMIKGTVECGLLEEDLITTLLREKYGIEKDYEWYMDDYAACGLYALTDIKIKDFLELSEGTFRRILGIPLG